jgi:hypothetical protein
MKSERARPNEVEPPLSQFVTDSMILTETYVDAAIRGQRVSLSESLKPAQGIVYSMFLGLLFWLLTLLIVIVL